MEKGYSFVTHRPLLERVFPNREWVLLLLLLAEIAAFSFAGENFLSRSNGFEIVRLGVEVGLLALAMTPIIITGGIDLSVGSMMGLAAVLFGAAWSVPRFSAVVAALDHLTEPAAGLARVKAIRVHG